MVNLAKFILTKYYLMETKEVSAFDLFTNQVQMPFGMGQ
jgi:hypothetical protein